MALVNLTGPTIAAGESLSDGLDCTGGTIVRITMPAEWTGANLTFQVSTAGSIWSDLYGADGREVTLAVKPGGTVIISPTDTNLRALAFIKVRSGSSQYPVRQEAERQFIVTIDDGTGRPN